jgi:hypothetical protein
MPAIKILHNIPHLILIILVLKKTSYIRAQNIEFFRPLNLKQAFKILLNTSKGRSKILEKLTITPRSH